MNIRARAMWLLGPAGLAAALLWSAPAAGQAKLYHNRHEAIALAFPEGVERSAVPLQLNQGLIDEISSKAKVEAEFKHTECFQGRQEGKVVGYACIDNMVGHERYITYLIRIDHPQGAIAFLEIMQHREVSGNLVHYPHFLRRFPGKTIADQVWNGRDVPLISGATKSCEALTGGARKILRLYDLYLKQLPGL